MPEAIYHTAIIFDELHHIRIMHWSHGTCDTTVHLILDLGSVNVLNDRLLPSMHQLFLNRSVTLLHKELQYWRLLVIMYLMCFPILQQLSVQTFLKFSWIFVFCDVVFKNHTVSHKNIFLNNVHYLNHVEHFRKWNYLNHWVRKSNYSDNVKYS